MTKEKAAGGEKETSKGGFASEQTPHPSSCPFRCFSSSHTNRFAGFAWELCPLCTPPLKRPRRGLRPPLPWIFPGVRFVLKLFQICKTRYRCGFGKPARSSKYSAAVSDVSCTAELVALRLSDFHTSNIQRAQKSDLHGLSCAWETRFYGRPKGVLTTETKRQNARQNDKLFRRVSAISRPASLFCILFSDKPEKSMSAKRYSTNWVQKGGCNAIPASISRRAVGPQSH